MPADFFAYTEFNSSLFTVYACSQLPHPLSRPARRVEHRRPGDQHGGSGMNDPRRGLWVDAAVDL
jgi:hypothetical protein